MEHQTIFPQEADVREEPEHIFAAGESQAFLLSPGEVPDGYPDPPPMESFVVRYGVICYSYDSSKDISQHMKKSVETLNQEFGNYLPRILGRTPTSGPSWTRTCVSSEPSSSRKESSSTDGTSMIGTVPPRIS